jgi:hypothetical protein
MATQTKTVSINAIQQLEATVIVLCMSLDCQKIRL